MGHGRWRLSDNLQRKVQGNAPAVVFLLCLLSLAVAFGSFAFYARGHAVKNPDVAQDWNKILGALADLRLCALPNETGRETAAAGVRRVVSAPLLGERTPADEASANWTYVSLLVPLVLTGGTEDQKPSNIHTTLTGSQLGLKGPAGKETLNVTLHYLLEREQNDSTCVSLAAPAHILPQTRLPPLCPASEEQRSGHSVVSIVVSQQHGASPQECFQMRFSPDPSFTVMLSQEDRDLACHHLMIFSGSLLALCAVLCFIGTFSCTKSRRYHGNGLDLQKEPLLDS
ncbi:transmembrane protein 248 isoform X2 [Scleropages formosus]|uniref:transmembrane protein 248 isoform X2 n=1 Tax=Scleropages formosus TaxID=113540 RepID=UPI000877F486|nr:transmembrane protein 248-like isoform X2 [Scleropages formosus]